ncbi:tetratricopeptide repeat protein [Acidobacteria bacterium AH-259-L09]|nr:tetratricopeptide repeat protein [Acidobacteria bacterium AH-259-L09]
MRKTTFILLVGLLLSVAVLAQAAQNIAAKVLSIQGRVEVQQSPWASAHINQILYPGNIIRTGPRSRAALLMADETQLKLSENSELELRAVRPVSNLLVRVAVTGPRADQSILNLNRGRAWLRSKRTPAPVQVKTPAVTAAIRGTEFDIQVAEDGYTVATVLEGSINFFNDLGTVFVNPGEQGRCRVGEAPTKVVILNPEDAVQWTLYYMAVVSPRDYPFLYASPQQALANLDGPSSDPVRTAQIQHDAGNLQAALAALEGASSPEAAETRGWIYLEQNRIGEAFEQFTQAPADSPRTRLGLSLAHYRVNEFEQAYNYVADPGADGRLKTQKAMLDLLAGDVENSRALLESISPDDPFYFLGQGLLSNVHLTQNDKDAALAAAERAVQSNPNSPSAYLNLSLVQQSFFDLPAATGSVEKALELDPQFLQAQVQYAKLLFGAGNSGKAETVIREALASAPQEAAVHSALGFVLLARGETREARVHLQRSIELDNTRGEPRLGLGIAHMREANYADAVLQILEATTLEPRISLYQSYLGKAFYEQRKFEQAFTALQAAMELDPRDPTPHLYSGIFQEDLNRPGIAVKDFQESIRLNDNRAVYRSRFVLDEDRATRNIKLATAYNRLGLTEWANLEAVKSYAADPTNSSTRIFLADTFLNLDGRTVAGGSELLTARLLLPVNTNSFNAFNDYTSLFELPRLNWSTQGSAGNLDTYAQSLIASGGARRFAFGSIFSQDRSDGWRLQNDDSRSYTTFNLFKFAPTPHSDLLLSFSHSQTRQGDRGIGRFVVTQKAGHKNKLLRDPQENDPDLRFFERINRAEIGYHHQFHPGSELLVYFSGRTFETLREDQNAGKAFFGRVDVDTRTLSREPNLSLQATHLLKISDFQLKYGFDIFEGRSRSRTTNIFCESGPPEEGCVVPGESRQITEQEFDLTRDKIRFKTIFLQGDYIVSPKLIFTAGLNYDWARRYSIEGTGDVQISMDRWNPQAGFLVSPFQSTTFRFSFARTLQTNPQERLVPTHLYGFVLSPNELERTRSTGYDAGWDQRLFGGKTFIRTTAFWRDRTIPTDGNGDLDADFYGGRFVVNQFLTDRLTWVTDYAITRDLFVQRHDHDLRLGLFYIHPRGYFFGIEEEYLNQSDLLGQLAEKPNVWTTNVSISYEMPDKLGLLTLELSNIFNRKYEYLADPLALDPRVPRRQLSFGLNFFF